MLVELVGGVDVVMVGARMRRGKVRVLWRWREGRWRAQRWEEVGRVGASKF